MFGRLSKLGVVRVLRLTPWNSLWCTWMFEWNLYSIDLVYVSRGIIIVCYTYDGILRNGHWLFQVLYAYTYRIKNKQISANQIIRVQVVLRTRVLYNITTYTCIKSANVVNVISKKTCLKDKTFLCLFGIHAFWSQRWYLVVNT